MNDYLMHWRKCQRKAHPRAVGYRNSLWSDSASRGQTYPPDAARTRTELQRATRLKDRERFRNGYLEPLLGAGLLEMTIPDKPRSSRQRYRTSAAGVKMIRGKSAL
jgi:hypothetical protein